MSSPRFSRSSAAGVGRHCLLPLGALALVLCGCASAPSGGNSASSAEGAAPTEVPPRVLTLYEQAVAAMAGGDAIEAELQFRAFLLQNPDYPGAHVNLAILMSAKGEDAAAAEHISAALALDPAHPAALNQLGMLERRRGRFQEAESAYMKAVTASPGYALAHYNLGVLNELYLQRLDTALEHFERYLEFGGDDEQVSKWVTDLKRRLGTVERTANVTE